MLLLVVLFPRAVLIDESEYLGSFQHQPCHRDIVSAYGYACIADESREVGVAWYHGHLNFDVRNTVLQLIPPGTVGHKLAWVTEPAVIDEDRVDRVVPDQHDYFVQFQQSPMLSTCVGNA